MGRIGSLLRYMNQREREVLGGMCRLHPILSCLDSQQRVQCKQYQIVRVLQNEGITPYACCNTHSNISILQCTDMPHYPLHHYLSWIHSLLYAQLRSNTPHSSESLRFSSPVKSNKYSTQTQKPPNGYTHFPTASHIRAIPSRYSISPFLPCSQDFFQFFIMLASICSGEPH